MKKITEKDYIVLSSEINPNFSGDRYNGGYAKKITDLDKELDNSKSLLGTYLKHGEEGIYRVSEGCLYFDCDRQGSRTHQTNEYTLFTIINGEIDILHSFSNYCNGTIFWIVDFWDHITDFLLKRSVCNVQTHKIEKTAISNISTDEIIKELSLRGYDVTTLAAHITMCHEAITKFRAIELDETL